MYDVIIIGGGPAGMNAALYLLRNNKKVLILEKETFGGQIATSPRLENFPTIKSISGSEFSGEFFQQILDLGVEFDIEEVISVFKTQNNTFEITTNYHKYECSAVIIANGVKHRTLNLPNEPQLVGKGISYCAVCDGPFFKDNEVNLVGDANTALQYALLLTDYCPKVNMFTMTDKLFGEKVLIDAVLKNPKINITPNMLVKELISENSELKEVKFTKTDTNEEITLPLKNLFVAIGQVPNNHLFEGILEMEDGFIKTNDKMETTMPGIFAAGDTRKKAIKQVITACSDGSIAAISALNYLNNL